MRVSKWKKKYSWGTVDYRFVLGVGLTILAMVVFLPGGLFF